MLCTLAAISYIITFLIYIHYIITSLVFCPSPIFFCVHVCGRVLFCYCCCCCSLVHSVNCLWIFNTTLLPSQQSLFDVVVVIVVIVRHTFLGGERDGRCFTCHPKLHGLFKETAQKNGNGIKIKSILENLTFIEALQLQPEQGEKSMEFSIELTWELVIFTTVK